MRGGLAEVLRPGRKHSFNVIALAANNNIPPSLSLLGIGIGIGPKSRSRYRQITAHCLLLTAYCFSMPSGTFAYNRNMVQLCYQLFNQRMRLAFLLFLLLVVCGYGAGNPPADEKGLFEIFVDGKQIGQEKFSIQNSPGSIRSNSVVAFRSPDKGSRSVRIESQLNMDDQYMPQSYAVRTDIDGQKGLVEGTFIPRQASFKYLLNGTPTKSGLLLDDYYVVLDTNIFHHFIFVGRLFDFNSSDQTQSLDVVIPQELDTGVLIIRDAGIQETSMRGKGKKLHHLKVDSGKVLIDLWLDDQSFLQKISLPGKNIEVIRKP
jgi:hypothetical protein